MHIRSQDLYLNSLHGEIGRGSYFPSTTGTTESQLLVARGYLKAYQATGLASYLTRAKDAVNAFFDFYGFGVEPTGVFYKFQWAGNLGAEYLNQGTVTTDPANSGHLAETTYFGSGYTLITNLSKVYSIGAAYTNLTYKNVFAPVEGETVAWEFYYNSTGQKFNGDNVYQEGADDISQAGKLKLVGSSSSQHQVTYSTLEASSTIPYKTLAEFWSVWRKLGNNRRSDGDIAEYNMAGDSIHWALDVALLLVEIEPSVPLWQSFRDSLLVNWNTCCAQLDNLPTNVFTRTGRTTEVWNSDAYAFVKVTRVGLPAVSPPDTYFPTNPQRDSSGYITITAGADATRVDLVLENDHIFTTFKGASDSFSIEVNSSIAQNLYLLLKDSDGMVFQKHLWLTAGGSLGSQVIPLSEFTSLYKWGDSSTVSYKNSFFTCTLNDSADGIGFPTTLASLALQYTATVTNPLTTLWAKATYSGGTNASVQLATTGVTASTVLTAPEDQTITNVDFYLQGSDSLCTMVLGAPADVAIQGETTHLRSVTLSTNSTAAFTLKVGDVLTTGLTALHEPVTYAGALPFQIGSRPRQSDGTAGYIGQASAVFVGNFYTGYQSVIPYILQEEHEKAYVIGKMLRDSQVFYRGSTGDFGAYAPVYNQLTADGVWNGEEGTFSWQGADPNTFWGGFQYRAFEAAAKGAYYARLNSSTAFEILFESAMNFAKWLDDFLDRDPNATMIPSYFPEDEQASITYDDPMMVALALKACLYLKLIGVNRYDVLLERLFGMLQDFRVVSGDITGAYSPDAAKHIVYGYAQGEILEALALFKEVILS